MATAEAQATGMRPKLVTDAARTPPHDLDAEAAVLSASLFDKDALDTVADVLKPEHFYSEAHRRIYEAAIEIHGRGQPVDVVQVATELRDRERLSQVGGMAYLTEVLNAAPAVANARSYAETVRDKWIARQVLWTCAKYEAFGYADYGTAQEYVNGVSQAVYEIACEHTPRTTSTVREALTRNFQAIQAAAQAGRSITGLATGFDRYDRLTAGLHDGELTIVAARPGMGKTSLAIGIGTNVASTSIEGATPQGVIIFSLEMPTDQVSQRLLCCEARVDVSRVRTGMLAPSDWTKLQTAAGQIANWPIWIDDQSAPSIVDIRAKARRVDAEARKTGRQLRLVIVDYLQLMSGTKDYRVREQEVSEVSRGLKSLAKDLKLPVLALAQLNREPEKRAGNKRPQLADLRESGAIEQDADNVCFIYRDEQYNDETEDRNIAELILAKQRSGPTDTVRVRFDKQYTRFDNLADGWESDDEDRRHP